MICPNCEAEYREGFTECVDCHVPLVKELPEPPPFDPDQFTQIALDNDPGDIAVLKSILESEQITFEVYGEVFAQQIRTLGPVSRPKLLVQKVHEARVREIMADLGSTEVRDVQDEEEASDEGDDALPKAGT